MKKCFNDLQLSGSYAAAEKIQKRDLKKYW
jgi:hypothetical protein